jgi:hypothetical protein
MKRSFLCLSLMCLLAAAVQAGPVLSGPVAQCSSFDQGATNPNDLVIPYSVFSVANFACEGQDKIYSNFNLGALPSTSSLRIQLQPLGSVDYHTVTFNGNFANDFSLSYDVAVDLALSPFNHITSVTGDISNPSNQGTPSNTKAVYTEAGLLLGTLVSSPGNPGAAIATFETAVHVADTYLASGGAAVSISNTFRQDLGSSTPEPVSYFLTGAGLLGLASLRRLRRRA